MISEMVAVENNVILETRKRKASDRANTDCRRKRDANLEWSWEQETKRRKKRSENGRRGGGFDGGSVGATHTTAIFGSPL